VKQWNATLARKPSAAAPIAARLLQRKCACGNHTAGGECTPCAKQQAGKLNLVVNTPGDADEREADQVADRIMETADGDVPRSAPVAVRGHAVAVARETNAAPPTVQQTLSSPGRPLDASARLRMERRFGRDFSRVRVHTDASAVASAQAVSARAYTVGRNIVFGQGQYADDAEGRRLLAHELTHVLQDSDAGGAASTLRRTAISLTPTEAAALPQEMPRISRPPQGQDVPLVPRTGAVSTPETCPPPQGLACAIATDNPGTITSTFIFSVGSAILNARQVAEIDAAAASWHAAGGSATVRVDGYASPEGACEANWDLSCRRASAVAAELQHPSDGSPGVPSASIDRFAHGESAEFGSGLAPNRKALISIPSAPPAPPSTPAPPCTLPVALGSARGCGSGTDFAHFDFPHITGASTAKLTTWALLVHGRPTRGLVTNLECEAEMDATLRVSAGAAGHAAFSRFAAGTGGIEILGPTSALGRLALSAPSFRATVASVQTSIEAQLATQATAGRLDPCALSLVPPQTHFPLFGPDDVALQAVIGGTQGEKLFAASFAGSIGTRSYTMTLQFVICDDFGVDEADLYSPGLIPFWVLQHERSATAYAPFINQLELPVTIHGTF